MKKLNVPTDLENLGHFVKEVLKEIAKLVVNPVHK